MTQAPPKPPPPADTARKVRRILWFLCGTVLAAVVIGAAVLMASNPSRNIPALEGGAQLVREDSHRLTTPAIEIAQLVEFLDFECGPCRAAAPLMEELKEEYGDRITFVQRHFPLPGHQNSGTAALAVEAAAQQGKYEPMAARIFETQPQWANKNDSQAALFRTFAQELGLDMTQYDAAIADEGTQDRIRKDVNDGTALGVNGTPSFFLDGKKLTLKSEEQFRKLLDDAAK